MNPQTTLAGLGTAAVPGEKIKMQKEKCKMTIQKSKCKVHQVLRQDLLSFLSFDL
ncbi:MAG: hypothetical protein KAT11_05680 [Phycisphaerae bacterium]|nr:hypothetical protein [Phycisphaerae bacterium]